MTLCGLLSVSQQQNQDLLILCAIFIPRACCGRNSQVLFSDLEDEGLLGYKARIFIPTVKVSASPGPVNRATFRPETYGLWPADSCRGYSRGRKQNFLTQSFTGTSKVHCKNCPSSLLTCSFTPVQDKKGQDLTETAQHQCKQLHQGRKQQGIIPLICRGIQLLLAQTYTWNSSLETQLALLTWLFFDST